MSSSPNFLIPGASRSGTTSLHHYLKEHDDIFLPEQKELHFFERNEEYKCGLDYYESQFDEWNGESAIGEISPPYWYKGKTYDNGEYVWDPTDDAPTRISQAYPDIKMVITLRNPLRRLYSQYWKNVRQGYERTYPLREAIKEELSGKRSPENTSFCWLYANRYDDHLEHLLELFDRDQFLFLVFEKWIHRPEKELEDICEFLGVEPKSEWTDTGEIKNASQTPRSLRLNYLYHDYLKWTGVGEVLQLLNLRRGYPKMDEGTASLISEQLTDIIDRVEDIIKEDLEIWRDEIKRMKDEPSVAKRTN